MTPAIRNLAKFTRDLLNQPGGSVVNVGRENVNRDSFTDLQIIIDSVGLQERIAKSKHYDGDSEVMTVSQTYRCPCTIDFYGDDASVEAEKFVLLCQSQKAFELSRDLGVAVYLTSGLVNLRFLTGEQYSNRIQLSLDVWTTPEVNVDTLRIDTAEVDFTFDKR